ncbi:MAG: ABC transporter ATP-binding protein [Acetatifactor sp.]|nr:ABC transporter ATP-binding protein [Acetatifactor sp.]
MEILRTEHLCRVYGQGENQICAVDDANISVAQGEFVAVVGSSGSGKSTLLHILGGVDRPTSGRVLIEDKDIFKMKDDQLAVFRRRQVGLIYQFYNLIPVLDVEENMTLPCELDGRKVDREYVQELAATLGLNKVMRHLPNQLSGGQQQRVAIGRALITRPAILLADEPTGNLDTRSGNEIMELLKLSNQKYKQTIIMITHNLELAKQADRVLVIEDGRVRNGSREVQF